jgi:hypothetical protein
MSKSREQRNIELSSNMAMYAYMQGYTDAGGDPNKVTPDDLKEALGRVSNTVMEQVAKGKI